MSEEEYALLPDRSDVKEKHYRFGSLYKDKRYPHLVFYSNGYTDKDGITHVSMSSYVWCPA